MMELEAAESSRVEMIRMWEEIERPRRIMKILLDEALAHFSPDGEDGDCRESCASVSGAVARRRRGLEWLRLER